MPRATSRFLGLAFLASLCVTPSSSAAADYADMRVRAQHAYAEKAYELSATLGLLQHTAKQSSALLTEIEARCGAATRTQ